MENFKNFEIENQDMIFGGEMIKTRYSSSNGTHGEDRYDTATETAIYFPSE